MTAAPHGLRAQLRAVVRSVAAAVYATIGASLVASWLSLEGWGLAAAQVVLAAVGVFVLARATEAPAWAIGLVGLFVALFDVAVFALLGGVEVALAAWATLASRAFVVGAPPLVLAAVLRRRRATP